MEVDIASKSEGIEDVGRRIATSEGATICPNGLPADLNYLMTLVRGICGQECPDSGIA